MTLGQKVWNIIAYLKEKLGAEVTHAYDFRRHPETFVIAPDTMELEVKTLGSTSFYEVGFTMYHVTPKKNAEQSMQAALQAIDQLEEVIRSDPTLGGNAISAWIARVAFNYTDEWAKIVAEITLRFKLQV